MKLHIFLIVAAFIALGAAQRRQAQRFIIRNRNVINNRSKLINNGRSDLNTVKIQVKKDNSKLDSEKLVGFIPVKSSKGDTYLIPKEAIEAIQKQYDANGNSDGAILVPERIIEVDNNDIDVALKENYLDVIDNKEISNVDEDEDIIAVINDPELLGRQARRRRGGRRRGGRRRGGRRRGGRRRGGRRRGGRRRGGRRRGGRRGGGRRRGGRRRGGRRRGGGRRGIHIRRGNGRRGGGKRRYIIRGCPGCPGRHRNSFRRLNNRFAFVRTGNGMGLVFNDRG